MFLVFFRRMKQRKNKINKLRINQTLTITFIKVFDAKDHQFNVLNQTHYIIMYFYIFLPLPDCKP